MVLPEPSAGINETKYIAYTEGEAPPQHLTNHHWSISMLRQCLRGIDDHLLCRHSRDTDPYKQTFFPAVTLGAVRSTYCNFQFPYVNTFHLAHVVIDTCLICMVFCGQWGISTLYVCFMWLPGIFDLPGNKTSQERWLPGRGDSGKFALMGNLISREIWFPRKGDYPGTVTSLEGWLPGKSHVWYFADIRILVHSYDLKCWLAQRGTLSSWW